MINCVAVNMQNLRDKDQEGSLEWLMSTDPELNLNQATKKKARNVIVKYGVQNAKRNFRTFA